MTRLMVALCLFFISCGESTMERLEKDRDFYRTRWLKTDSALNALTRDTSRMKEIIAYRRLPFYETVRFENVVIAKVGRINIAEDYSFHMDGGWRLVFDSIKGQTYNIAQLKQISDLIHEK